MYFDRNFKLKPNHLQILIIRHGVKKVVHPVYKKAEIIKNDERCIIASLSEIAPIGPHVYFEVSMETTLLGSRS
jgi:hypothetical protein